MNWANCHTNVKKNVETAMPTKHTAQGEKLQQLNLDMRILLPS